MNFTFIIYSTHDESERFSIERKPPSKEAPVVLKHLKHVVQVLFLVQFLFSFVFVYGYV